MILGYDPPDSRVAYTARCKNGGPESQISQVQFEDCLEDEPVSTTSTTTKSPITTTTVKHVDGPDKNKLQDGKSFSRRIGLDDDDERLSGGDIYPVVKLNRNVSSLDHYRSRGHRNGIRGRKTKYDYGARRTDNDKGASSSSASLPTNQWSKGKVSPVINHANPSSSRTPFVPLNLNGNLILIPLTSLRTHGASRPWTGITSTTGGISGAVGRNPVPQQPQPTAYFPPPPPPQLSLLNRQGVIYPRRRSSFQSNVISSKKI